MVVAPDGKYAYVAGQTSNSLAVVDVGTHPTTPSLKGSYFIPTYMDHISYRYRVAVSPDGMYAYVTGESTNALAVVDTRFVYMGDGYCDLLLNTHACGWDEGDGCEDTCVSGASACTLTMDEAWLATVASSSSSSSC